MNWRRRELDGLDADIRDHIERETRENIERGMPVGEARLAAVRKLGNVALAGHRDTFFRELRNIQRDDTIDFETERGTFRYAVESTRIVGPKDVSVLNASGGHTLTLVTCYPFYYVGSAPKRFIVRAVEVGTAPSHGEMSVETNRRRSLPPGS